MKNYKLKSSLITIAIIAFTYMANANSFTGNNSSVNKANLAAVNHLSTSKKDAMAAANAYENQGSYYAFINKKYQAIIAYGMAELMYKIACDTAGIASSSFKASMIYFEKGKYYIGINGLLSVLKLSQLTNDSVTVADCLSNLGNGYYELKQYDTALEYMHKQLELSHKLNDQRKVSDAYKNLAKTYQKLNCKDEAQKYLQLFANLAESLAKK
ncbi:MAG: tetratricopeptide repeat protein [Bacteroidia bacterium]